MNKKNFNESVNKRRFYKVSILITIGRKLNKKNYKRKKNI